jgi:hypothetical protein
MFGFFKKKTPETPKANTTPQAPMNLASPQTNSQVNPSSIPDFNIISNPANKSAQNVNQNLTLPEFPPLPEFNMKLNSPNAGNNPTNGKLPSLPDLPSFDSHYTQSQNQFDIDSNEKLSQLLNNSNLESPIGESNQAVDEKSMSKSTFNLDEHAPELPEFDEEFEKELASMNSQSKDSPNTKITPVEAVKNSTKPQAKQMPPLPDIDDQHNEMSTSYTSQGKTIYVDVHRYQDILIDINGMRNDIKHIHEESHLLQKDEEISARIEDLKKETQLMKQMVVKIDSTLFIR